MNDGSCDVPDDAGLARNRLDIPLYQIVLQAGMFAFIVGLAKNRGSFI